jgi:hypothetical protein
VKWFHRGLHTLDALLLVKVFMPLVHYIDWRWHKNHFDVASMLLTFGLVTYVAGCANTVIKWHDATSVFPMAAGALQVLLYKDWIANFKKASKALERSPNNIPREAYTYFMWPACVRAGAFVMTFSLDGVMIMPPVGWFGLTSSIYFSTIVFTLYLAICFPSGRDRKKKKVRAPLFGQLLPTTR